MKNSQMQYPKELFLFGYGTIAHYRVIREVAFLSSLYPATKLLVFTRPRLKAGWSSLFSV